MRNSSLGETRRGTHDACTRRYRAQPLGFEPTPSDDVAPVTPQRSGVSRSLLRAILGAKAPRYFYSWN